MVDAIADIVSCSVAGCMGAQVYHEINKDKDGVVFVVVEGTPVGSDPRSLAAKDQMGQPVAIAVATPVTSPPVVIAQPVASGPGGAPPTAESMQR